MNTIKTVSKKLYNVAKWSALFFWLMYIDVKAVNFIGPTITLIGNSIACVAGELCEFSGVDYRIRK
jgi:hypothetical protein